MSAVAIRPSPALVVCIVAASMATHSCSDGVDEPTFEPPEVPFEIRALRVPVDEADAAGDTIDLRYLWFDETGVENPPVLVFQFGGPGSSAVEFLAFVSTTLPDWVLEQFALVGLDEIGVGGSVPFQCAGFGATDSEAYNNPFVASTETELVELWSGSVPPCREQYSYTSLVGTERHARDLERLRVALGVSTLNFMTYSYGTRVALTYAALFPERTGRVVLDSPVDPQGTYVGQLRAQAEARAASIALFLEWCEGPGGCGFSRQDLFTAMATLAERPSSSALALIRILDELLFEPQWPDVAAVLSDVLADVDAAPQIVDVNLRVIATPSFIGTLCTDAALDSIETIDAERQAFEASLDTDLPAIYFSDVFNGAYACVYWPSAEPAVDWPEFFSGPAVGLDLLLVNASGDIRSPQSLAEALAAAVPSASRIRVDEVSHSISLQSVNECVDTRIRAFLTGEGDPVSGVVDCPKSAFAESNP